MNDILGEFARHLAAWLGERLPALDAEWWRKHVVDRLTFQQQRNVRDRRLESLGSLDLASLLRVLDQNWHELAAQHRLAKDARNWVKEMHAIRNRWAHAPSGGLAAQDVYRDADTLGRLAAALEAPAAMLAAVEGLRASALQEMGSKPAAPEPAPTTNPPPAPADAAKSSTRFSVGDIVALASDPKVVFPVIEVLVSAGSEVRYRVFHNGAKSTYYESQLKSTSPAPERKTLSRRDLGALLTAKHLAAPSAASLYSFNSGRIKFVPYQYRPVFKLIGADRPRLLIADEVGVGKTIETGLILKELQARADVASVLIICPKALVAERKWEMEMRRFEESFTPLDGRLLRHCINETHLEGQWPTQYQRAIVPFSLFDADLLTGKVNRGRAKDIGLLELDPPPRFDVVIVDEAHHIRNSDTYLHQAVRYFCDHADAAIFLSATPVQLGSRDLFTLLNVLRPDVVIDEASFQQMAEPNVFTNQAIKAVRAAKPGWEEEVRDNLRQAADTEWGRNVLAVNPGFQHIYDALGEQHDDSPAGRLKVLSALEALYSFSSIITRTRRRDIGEFTTRKPETVTTEFTPAQASLHDRLLDVIRRTLAQRHGNQNLRFLMTTVSRQAASCIYGLGPMLEDMLNGRLDQLEVMESADAPDFVIEELANLKGEIRSLIEDSRSLPTEDPKAEAFLRIVLDKQKLANNKLLVFSTFRHTIAYLSARLTAAGVRHGVVHGGVPDEERQQLRRRFAATRDSADALDVLLSSEVGCEGLDFQFSDCLVNYDLPWNPMRIEQRIGRIDRYGQKSEAVAIFNLLTSGTIDEAIYHRCLLRIGVFHHAVGGGEEILGEITREIHEISESFSLTEGEKAAKLQQLADNKVRDIEEQRRLEERQGELFGINLRAKDWADELEAARNPWLAPEALETALQAYLARRLGTDQQMILGEKALKTLRLSQEARGALLDDFRTLPRTNDRASRTWERWLKGNVPNLSVTFEQETASEYPEAVLLSLGHPLIRQAVRHIDEPDPVWVSLTLQSSDLPPGEHPFAIYRWSRTGLRKDEELVGVAASEDVAARLLDVLPACASDPRGNLPDQAALDALDGLHFRRWTAAAATHKEESAALVGVRRQSLEASHAARMALLDSQIAAASNDKIRLMKNAERDRADADYRKRAEETARLAESADIHAAPVVFGILRVGGA